jgi:hypothetical protein
MEAITLITILGSALVLLCTRDDGTADLDVYIPRAPRIPRECSTQWDTSTMSAEESADVSAMMRGLR